MWFGGSKFDAILGASRNISLGTQYDTKSVVWGLTSPYWVMPRAGFEALWLARRDEGKSHATYQTDDDWRSATTACAIPVRCDRRVSGSR
jgi:hypothetical protein